jgi:hypothetical protein
MNYNVCACAAVLLLAMMLPHTGTRPCTPPIYTVGTTAVRVTPPIMHIVSVLLVGGPSCACYQVDFLYLKCKLRLVLCLSLFGFKFGCCQVD